MHLVGWQTLGIIAIMDGVECIHSFGAGGTLVQTFFLIPPDPNPWSAIHILPSKPWVLLRQWPSCLSKEAFQSNAPCLEPRLGP